VREPKGKEMNVCITAVGPGLYAQIDPRFGRSQYFTIVDIETMEHRSLENPNIEVAAGAGPQSARMMADEGVDAVITRNVGPNAMTTLKAAGIKIYMATTGSVREAVEAYEKSSLEEISDQRVRF
jgi:predicted Fe-Mo cluster-binding NifX family protein